MSIVKRVPLVGRVRAEFRAEMLNAFNRPWFVPVGTASSNPDNYRVTGLTGETTSRIIQLVVGVTW